MAASYLITAPKVGGAAPELIAFLQLRCVFVVPID